MVADLYYPGWRVYVDGEESKIEQADYCLRAVALEPGEHHVEMVYAPWSFRMGLWCVLASLIGIAAVVGPRLKSSRKRE